MAVLVACGCTRTLCLCWLLVGAQEHYDCVGCLWVHKTLRLCWLLVGAQEHYDCVGCLWVHKNIMAV